MLLECIREAFHTFGPAAEESSGGDAGKRADRQKGAVGSPS